MNTPTPRTDAAWSATFDGEQMSAGRTARALLEHSQQLETELAALTAERDQLRLDCDNETKWAAHYLAQSIADKARAERAEASLHAATEECTDVRLKWHAVMGTCAAKEDAIIELDEELARLRARAARAEDNLAALEQCHDDNCRGVVKIAADLAKERARLDSGQILLTVAGERVWHCGVDLRAAIDAGMQEGAK